jgi:hypothetical protein
MPMVERYTSNLERLGAPAWVRGAMVGVLAAILLGILGFVTYSQWSGAAPGRMIRLALLWVLGLVGCVILARLWSAVTNRAVWPLRVSKPTKDL